MISVNVIALNESHTVEADERYRHDRVFAVRPETCPTGMAYHGTHIPIERFKAPAPRLHLYDDTNGAPARSTSATAAHT
jgi:hypothetical protein